MRLHIQGVVDRCTTAQAVDSCRSQGKGGGRDLVGGERGGICREWKILESLVERSRCKSAMTQLLPQEREDVEERGGD